MLQTVPAPAPCTTMPPVRMPTAVVINRDGELPPSLTPFAPRLVSDTLTAVSPDDDVVILYGERRAPDVARLHRMLGRQAPAVLLINTMLDPADVIEAFDNGVTSYVVAHELPERRLVEAAVRTADGQSSLSRSAVMVLMDHRRQRSPATVPDAETTPPVTDELTPRECQVMELLVAGHTIAEIAGVLRLTTKTVRNNLSATYAKLHVHRQSEAILLWLGHQHKPGEPKRYNEPRHVPQLSPLRKYASQAL